MSAILKILSFFREALTDAYYSIKYNTYSPFEEKDVKLYYKLLIEVHTVEKGLSLADTRPLFGQSKIYAIIKMVQSYDSGFSIFPLEKVAGAFEAYLRFHRENDIHADVLVEMQNMLNAGGSLCGITHKGGVKKQEELVVVTPEKRDEVNEFLMSRYSARNYKGCKISDLDLDSIMETALLAPSQCNRQSVRVHYFSEKSKILSLLALQGGSKSFAECVPNLFVVSYELTAWGGAGQRNQGYVDGGLFAQQLMLALHAHGVVCCPLNLAVMNHREQDIKREAKMNNRERLVMMISFGYPATENMKAAKSPRISISDLLKKH